MDEVRVTARSGRRPSVVFCLNAHRLASTWVSTHWIRNEKQTDHPLPKIVRCTLEAVKSFSTEVCALIKLYVCLIPLALARIIPAIVNQTIFRSLTTTGDDIDELAGFGIAYNTYNLFECTLAAFCTVSQVLITSQRDRRQVLLMATEIAVVMIGFCGVLSGTKLGTYCIKALFHVENEVVCIAQRTLGYICANMIVQAMNELHTGIIIQAKDTTAILLASTMNLTFQMMICLSPFKLMKGGLFQPLILPIFAIYTGNAVKCIVIMTWYYSRIHKTLPEESEIRTTKLEIVRVFVPLGCLSAARSITVPFARIFMGKGLTEENAGIENAIFSLVLPVERLFTSWLNRLKDVYLAFDKDKTVFNTDRALVFTAYCLLLSVGGMSLFCGFHQVSDAYYHYIFRAEWHFARMCVLALSIFIYLPFFAGLRAHAVFWLVKSKHTNAIMTCVFLRLAAIPLVDIFLNWISVSGAQLAAGLCVACHGVEAVLLTIAALYYRRSQGKKNPEEEPLIDNC